MKEDFGEFKEKNEEFGEKLNTTFATSQENTMKIQMIENNHRVQQESFKNLENFRKSGRFSLVEGLSFKILISSKNLRC